jgi:multicomponent Na+:H+ antiporter subunit E
MKLLSFRSTAVLFCLLLALWLVLSGYFDVFHVGVGVVCVAAVLWMNRRLNSEVFDESQADALAVLRWPQVPGFMVWLVAQIVMSGLQVAWVLMHRRMPIATSIIQFRVDLPCEQAKVVLGNAITLTPGTLTIDIRDDMFTVHSLIPASYAGIVDDTMPRRVLRLFSAEQRAVVSEVRIEHATEGMA